MHLDFRYFLSQERMGVEGIELEVLEGLCRFGQTIKGGQEEYIIGASWRIMRVRIFELYYYSRVPGSKVLFGGVFCFKGSSFYTRCPNPEKLFGAKGVIERFCVSIFPGGSPQKFWLSGAPRGPFFSGGGIL